MPAVAAPTASRLTTSKASSANVTVEPAVITADVALARTSAVGVTSTMVPSCHATIVT